MKYYESKRTSDYLETDIPLYVRIDGRAFHTLCRGMKKPFDSSFTYLMQETCKHLVKETGANLGYVQSDEISLGWVSTDKAPFSGRLFKINSVLASIAGAIFMKTALTSDKVSTVVKERIIKIVPSFDCRALNLPSCDELVNAFIWRQNDCIKNAVSSVAHSMYSVNALNKKNQVEQIQMISDKGEDFYDYDSVYRLGTFYHRVNVLRPVSEDIIDKIKDEDKHINEYGEVCVIRSEVNRFDLPKITLIKNRYGVLFENEPIEYVETLKEG